MRDTQPPTDTQHHDGRELTVLFMGDQAIAEDLAAAAAKQDTAFAISHLSADAGIHRVLSSDFDCVVLTDDVEPDWAVLSTVDAPIILYGDTDAVRDEVAIQKTVDIILQQRVPPDASILLPTIRRLAAQMTAGMKLTDALDEVSAEPDAAAFLVDGDGHVRWSNADLSSLLPAETARQLPETTSLYEELAAVFQQSDGTPVSGKIDGPDDHDSQLLVTAVGEQRRYYRRYSYPVTTAGAERVELFQDMTATVESYDRLALFEDLVENAEDGLFVLDANWQVEYINQSYANMLGYEPEQLVGTHTAQQLSPGEMRRAQEATEALIEGDQESAVVDLTLERGDGREIEAAIHFWLRRAEDGEYAGVMGVVRDITDRKERKRELERYETIIQALGDPVCAFDAEGRFVYVNDAFEERTGYDNERVRGKPASAVINDAAVETAESLVQDLRADETLTTGTFEMELLTEGGDAIPTECQMALLPHEDGEFQGSVAVLRDITRVKQREQRLSKFASVVSHDLRNPLDVAMGRIEVLPDVADVDSEVQTHLDEVYDSLKRMEQLIEDVLTITRQREEKLELKPVSLDAVARDAWQNVNTGPATMQVAESVEIRANEPRLLRIFENLFRNAIEHGLSESPLEARGPEGGDGPEITVEVGTLETDWKRGKTGFYVADDGEGVPPDQRDQIFDDGFSTIAGGTGLGLTIVREIVRAHDWTIALEEGVDGGARFEFTGATLAPKQTE